MSGVGWFLAVIGAIGLVFQRDVHLGHRLLVHGVLRLTGLLQGIGGLRRLVARLVRTARL